MLQRTGHARTNEVRDCLLTEFCGAKLPGANQGDVKRSEGGLFYVATMIPTGAEDEARIARHRAERAGDGFVTIEWPRDIAGLLSADAGLARGDSSILLDSLTALLQNEMFGEDGIDFEACERVVPQLLQVLDAADNVVIVSDFIFADAGRYDEVTERYRKGLARLDRVAAARCDAVLEVAYSGAIVHKGSVDLGGLLR